MNVIKEFMDMKPGQRFLHDVGRIATALEKLEQHVCTYMKLHIEGYEAKYGVDPKKKADDG